MASSNDAVRQVAPDGQDHKSLTPRETDVLRNLCHGLTNKEIAGKLGIAELTIRLHLRGIYRKLDAGNRVHAVLKAHELGLLAVRAGACDIKIPVRALRHTYHGLF